MLKCVRSDYKFTLEDQDGMKMDSPAPAITISVENTGLDQVWLDGFIEHNKEFLDQYFKVNLEKQMEI